MEETGTALQEISKARQALIRAREAQDIHTVLTIRDNTMALAKLAEARGAGEVANDAKEMQLRSERVAGEILKGLERSPGPGRGKKIVQAAPSFSEYTTMLQEAGIEKTAAQRWQKMSDLPENEFEQYIVETREKEQELTRAAVLRLEAKLNRPVAADTPPLPDDKYRIIYADPPWRYGNSGVITGNDNYGRAKRHYTDMSIQELCDMGPAIKEMCDDNAVLFMWVTSPLLEECFDVIRAWGFNYKTSFVWDKVGHNFGHYNSVRHELLLVCTRGSCLPDNPKLYDSVQSLKKSNKHSEKPDEFRAIIDDLYHYGRRIELFSRQAVDGWDRWGNE